MKRRYFITLLAAVSSLFATALPTLAGKSPRRTIQPFQAKTEDETAILKVVADYNQFYEHPVVVTRLVIVSGYALYAWVLIQNSGGQTLMRRNEAGQWKIVRGTGGQLDLDFLRNRDVPEPIAQQLLKQMADQIAADQSKQ